MSKDRKEITAQRAIEILLATDKWIDTKIEVVAEHQPKRLPPVEGWAVMEAGPRRITLIITEEGFEDPKLTPVDVDYDNLFNP